MNPSADVLALASIEVDISAIQPGQAIKASWRGMPVFIRNLTAAEQAAAAKVPLSELRDPKTLAERTKEGNRNLLVTIGIRSEERREGKEGVRTCKFRWS